MNRLTEARLRAGFKSQADFAAELGVSRGLVGQWETGLKLPGRSNLAKIGERCLVSMAWLLGETDDPGRSFPITDPYEVKLLLQLRRYDEASVQRMANFLSALVCSR